MASGASGVRVEPESEDELRFGEALDYLLRRLALLIVRDGEGAGAGRPRGRPRRARAERGRGPRARWPTRRWSRPRCTAATPTGAGSRRRSARRCTTPRRCRSTSGSRTCRSAARGAALPFDESALAGAVAGDEVEYTVGLPGRGRRGRGVLLRPLARLRDDQRGVHDVMRDDRDAARGAPVHPRVPRPDGRDQVRRRGDERPGAARGLRARRRAPQVRRHEPDRRPRRRAGDHRLHGAAQPAGRVRRRAAGERRGDRRDRQDGARRQGQQGHRAAHQPPRAAGGRACAATTGCCSAVDTMEGPGGEDIGLVGRIERVNVGVIEHIAEDYIPVIASIGADRDGRSHNVNADEAAGAVARAIGAYKVMFLTDVPGLAARPVRPVVGDLRVRRRRGRGGAGAVTGGGMRPKLQACLDAIHGGVSLRAHRRRAGAALAAARAVHRRRPGHQDPARATLSALATTYARYPVEFASGSGCVLRRLRRRRVPRLPVRHRGLQHRPLPPARRGGDAGAGGRG